MALATASLPRNTNQARGIAEFAIAALAGEYALPAEAALARVEMFHWDAVGCGVSALGAKTSAPTVLRREALEYVAPNPQRGATCFGSTTRVWPEKAVVANNAAVREWDSNGTNFGYDPIRGNIRGEFGHNDFYGVVIAAAQQTGADGNRVCYAMLLLDEIRGRLAEVFALRTYKIDHVVHGAIASAAIYGAMLGATAEQIERAIGMVVAHYIPYRAIRAGKQLSDSKGASAAISSEVAVLSVQRAMRGFLGPLDIFRNPESVFCWNEKPAKPGESPFDLTLSAGGDDFCILGMHFKMGLYEHQSAGAIQGVIDLLNAHPSLLESPDAIESIEIDVYEPAFGIIGDPAKHDPRTRQSADHSMVYIIASLLKKAIQSRQTDWESLMLLPADYDDAALGNALTRSLMQKIRFRHGGPEYDARYPDGIPTSVTIHHQQLSAVTSGLVMYPLGHARNHQPQLERVLDVKFRRLAALGVADVDALYHRVRKLRGKTAAEIDALYSFPLLVD